MSRFLTLTKAAAQAGICQRTLERRLKSGTGPRVTRIGARVMVEQTYFDEWLAQCSSR